jgi:DNA-3-methyladenine glycosylase
LLISVQQRLPPDFFARSALEVAPDLLHLWFEFGGRRSRIVEVEAYTQDDPASHSVRGPTPRTSAMFGPPGHLYVYLIYGMHLCANIVTGPEGVGEAVLLRGVQDVSGPGRLTRWYGIQKGDDGAAAVVFDDGVRLPMSVTVTARIGITRATDWPRRWVLSGQANQCTSAP